MTVGGSLMTTVGWGMIRWLLLQGVDGSLVAADLLENDLQGVDLKNWMTGE